MKVSEPSEESSKPEESSAPQTEYDKKYVGQWKSVFNTAAYSAEQIKEFKEQLGWDEYNILLSDSGTASAYGVKDNITDISGTGTWKSEGDKLVVTIDGDAVEFKYNNGRLTTDVLINAVFFEKSYNPGTDPQPSQEPEPSETSQESSQTSEPSQNTVELPDVPSDAFGVICFEVPEDWGDKKIFVNFDGVFDYDGNKNENNSKLTFYSDGVYTYTVNKYSSTNYLFNNPKFIIISATKDSGKIVQTEEIYVSRGSKLYTAEKQGRKYVLTEK